MSDPQAPTRNWRIDIAGVIIVAGLVYLVIGVGYRPLYDAYQSFQTMSATRDETLQNHNRMSAAVELVGDRVDEARRELDKSPLHFRSRDHLNLQLATITKLAEAAGLTADQVQADRQVVSGEMFDAIPVSVAATGSFDACTDFLRSLSADLPDVAVNSLEISPRGISGEALTLRLRLLWYIHGDGSSDEERTASNG